MRKPEGPRPALDSELVEAQGSSLDWEVMLERVYPSIARLVPANYGAIGISPSGRPVDFRFSVSKLAAEFFRAYADMAEHDFVRKSVERCPNRVLCDQDMIERAEDIRRLQVAVQQGATVRERNGPDDLFPPFTVSVAGYTSPLPPRPMRLPTIS